MLYDDHRKLGAKHALAGFPRYKWSHPHLQKAYDEGYNNPDSQVEVPPACLYCGVRGMHDCMHQRMIRRR